ncbi:MAG: hypothetical protein WC306_02150 [Candidatus Paceibacterota bacterium]|jgi:hypothetical protein
MNNKTTKTIIIVLIAIVVIGAIYLLLSKKSEINIKTGETTTTIVASTSIDCKADQNCLSTNFLSCNPFEFKMEFIEPGSQFIIAATGKEGEKCHYLAKVVNPDGSIVTGTECQVPLSEISIDTVKNFFGLNTGAVKDKQAQLEKDYCVSL